MPTAARLSDKGTQHDGYYETVITAGCHHAGESVGKSGR